MVNYKRNSQLEILIFEKALNKLLNIPILFFIFNGIFFLFTEIIKFHFKHNMFAGKLILSCTFILLFILLVFFMIFAFIRIDAFFDKNGKFIPKVLIILLAIFKISFVVYFCFILLGSLLTVGG